MRRTAIFALFVAFGLVGVLGWETVARQRDYARLVDQGSRALARDETFLAVEAFSGAITLRPDSMLAYLRRGETYRRRGQFGEALRDLQKAAELDPTATWPLELLGDVNASLQRYDRAQESYESYLRLDERSPQVLYKLSLVRYRLGQPGPAVAGLRQDLALDDRVAAAYYLLGLCLSALDQRAEAVSALERAVKLDPGLSAAREQLAEAYSAVRRDKEAINQLEALAALEPGLPGRQLALGLAYGRQRRFDLAIITLRRVTEDHPGDPEVFEAIGRVWLEAAERQRDRISLGKALQALDEAARRSPPDNETLWLLGHAQMLAGDVVSAERTLQQATAQPPVVPAAVLELAAVAERAGHAGTARDALIRCTALSGDRIPPPDRALHLGDLSMRLNEPAAAIGWYSKASNDPSAAATAFVRLAEAQIQAGNQAGALATVQRGLQREPGNVTLLGLRHRLAATGLRLP